MKELTLSYWTKPEAEVGKLWLNVAGKNIALIEGAEKAKRVFDTIDKATHGQENRQYRLSVKPYDDDHIKEGEMLTFCYEDSKTN